MDAPTQNNELKKWVEEMARMCKPDKIFWCDGSEEEKERLTQEAISTGELIELNQEHMPGCVLHRTALERRGPHRGPDLHLHALQGGRRPANNWMRRRKATPRPASISRAPCKGRTMYVIPFCMGPVGSPFSKIGVELTDSIYVVLNMRIMTRMGKPVLDALGTDGEFTKCLHSKATARSKQAPHPALSRGQHHLERRLRLRRQRAAGQEVPGAADRQLPGPQGGLAGRAHADPGHRGTRTATSSTSPPPSPAPAARPTWPCSFRPRDCKRKGYRIWTVGDDIAWMRIDTDGRLWAINPETGFFGVAPGTNTKTNPNMMTTIKQNTIFTNVVLRDDGTVWWEGHDEPAPLEALGLAGKPWTPDLKDDKGNPVPGANRNSRFTAPIDQVPTRSNRLDSTTACRSPRSSSAAAAPVSLRWSTRPSTGSTASSSRPPWPPSAPPPSTASWARSAATRWPCCPSAATTWATTSRHWLDMGMRIPNPPQIFHVNWFRTDEEGKFLWPGFGENLRVIEWILQRRREEVAAVKTPIGYLPNEGALDMTGLDIPREQMEQLFAVDQQGWLKECDEVKAFFNSLGERMPQRLYDELEQLRYRLRRCCGPQGRFHMVW